MRRPGSLVPLLVLAACSPASGTSTTSAGPDTGAASTSASTGGSSASTAGDSSAGPGPTTSGSSSEGGSTSAGSSGSTSEGSSTTGEGTSGGPGSGTSGEGTSGSSTGASTGGGVVASFTCVETTPVELPLKESISGSFLADGTPVDLTAIMVKGGAIDFHVDAAVPVDPNDPNAADVAAFEMWLKMQGWDVNPPGDMSGDRRYFFAPKGAQNVAIFPAFYFRVYEGGGNGQFEFDCSLL